MYFLNNNHCITDITYKKAAKLFDITFLAYIEQPYNSKAVARKNTRSWSYVIYRSQTSYRSKAATLIK